MAAKIKLTITTSSPTSFCHYLQLLFQEHSPVLDSSRSYPIDPLGGPHQILLTAMMATAFCQTTPHPLGRPAYRRCSKLTKTRELHLSTIGPSIPKNFLFPQTRHLFGPTPQTPIQAATFLEQIKSVLPQPRISKIPRCGIFRSATCKLTRCGISADRQTSGQVSTQPKWGECSTPPGKSAVPIRIHIRST
jgi:hypothetical protein